MDAIRKAIGEVLTANEFTPYQVHTKLAPAWSTDSISPEGRKQLRDYGIAPPSTCCQHADGMTLSLGWSAHIVVHQRLSALANLVQLPAKHCFNVNIA